MEIFNVHRHSSGGLAQDQSGGEEQPFLPSTDPTPITLYDFGLTSTGLPIQSGGGKVPLQQEKSGVYELRDGVYKPRINKPQHEVLEALAEFGELTADQLLDKLRMKPGSKSYLFRQIRGLTSSTEEKSYVEVMSAPKYTQFGGSPSVYSLGPLGRRYLIGLTQRADLLP